MLSKRIKGKQPLKPKRPASPYFFPAFFAAVILLFCGILVFTYVESKHANPIMLDEQGNVR